MAKDATPSAPAHGVSEETYEALLATLSASAVGRSFLAEYARRNRAADTETLLAAMARLEAMIAAQSAQALAPDEPVTVAEAAEPATADALVKPAVLEKSDEAATEAAPVVDAEIPQVTWEAPPPADEFVVAAEPSAAEAPADASTQTPFLPAEAGIQSLDDKAGETSGSPLARGRADDSAPTATALAGDVVEQISIQAIALTFDAGEEIAPPDEVAALSPDTLEEAALVELAALSFEATEQAVPAHDEPEAVMPLRDESEPAMPSRDPLEQIMALSEEERIALFS
jgi:hypothetical protein